MANSKPTSQTTNVYDKELHDAARPGYEDAYKDDYYGSAGPAPPSKSASQASIRFSGVAGREPIACEDDYYGSAGPAPPTELPSEASARISNPAPRTSDPRERLASPATRARQEELARRVVAERENYLNTHNTSEAGSALDRHMTSFLHGLEDELTTGQNNLSAGDVDNAQNNKITTVNFRGIYGTIREIDHISTEEVPVEHAPITTTTNAMPPVVTSTAPTSYLQSAFSSPPRMTTSQRIRPANRGSGGLPHRRRALPRHTPTFADLRTQASVTSFIRNRPAANNCAEQAPNPPTASPSPTQASNSPEAPPTPANPRRATVEDAPTSPPHYQSPPRPIHAPRAQRPPHVLNLNAQNLDDDPVADNQDPPEYGQRALDLPLPPHLDPADPIGADFLQGARELRRAQDRISTFANSLGIAADDPAIEEIHRRAQTAAQHFTTGFRRAAATAADERAAHNMTVHLVNGLRLSTRALERGYMGMAARAEEAEILAAQLGHENERHGATAAAARLREQHLGALLGQAQQENAGLRVALRERRAENERLLREAEEAERNLFGL